jgi:predicted NAD/FAD-binding protein
VKAITNALGDRIRLETPVVSVRRSADEVQILVRDGSVETFDHVVFACHADQALRILGEEASDVEREVLSAFPYERNVAVLHTDTRLLPVNRRAWASWNYRVRVDPTAPALVTYNMNLLQSLNSRRTFCVTLNGLDMIAPEKVMGSFSYEHPIFTVRRDRYQARYRELLRANRTSYCGAYWGDGFHEAGVRSGLMVANAMREGSRRAEHAAEATTISPEIKRAPPEFQPMTPLDALS